jgi:hypothetical protein
MTESGEICENENVVTMKICRSVIIWRKKKRRRNRGAAKQKRRRRWQSAATSGQLRIGKQHGMAKEKYESESMAAAAWRKRRNVSSIRLENNRMKENEKMKASANVNNQHNGSSRR